MLDSIKSKTKNVKQTKIPDSKENSNLKIPLKFFYKIKCQNQKLKSLYEI